MAAKPDKKNKSPLYIQLYDKFAEEIRSGKLPNGSKLPPRRKLAEELGVSGNTVDSAYKMLQDTGYVISIPRSGYTVSFKPLLYEPVSPWEIDAPEKIVFSPNGTDYSHMGRTPFTKIMRGAADGGIELFSYVSKSGEEELRAAISKYLYSFRDIKCPPDRIIIGAGAEYLLTALAAALPPRTPVVMENPCDPHYYQALRAYGQDARFLPAGDGDVDIKALSALERGALFIDPYTRFPRGKTADARECAEILDWAASADGRYIIENAERAELSGISGSPLFGADKNEKTIYLGSFSKTMCPAVKTSYMALPEELLTRWKNVHLYYYALSSKAEQYTLAEFIEKGHFIKHCKDMRGVYKDKLDCLRGRLAEEFGDKIEICGVCRTYLTARFRGKDIEDIIILARRNGVKLLSFNSFCVHGTAVPSGEDKIIFGIGDLSHNEIRRGVMLLRRVFE